MNNSRRYETPQDALRAGEIMAVKVPTLSPFLVVAAVMRKDGTMVWADGNLVDPGYSGHAIHETRHPVRKIHDTAWQDGDDGPVFYLVPPQQYRLVNADLYERWKQEHPDEDMQRLLEEREALEQVCPAPAGIDRRPET